MLSIKIRIKVDYNYITKKTKSIEVCPDIEPDLNFSLNFLLNQVHVDTHQTTAWSKSETNTFKFGRYILNCINLIEAKLAKLD